MVITGRAYGRRATLDVNEDALTWRARKGAIESTPENIATTTHEIDTVRWIERRYSAAGGVLAILSGIWIASESVAIGLIGVAVALALIAYRFARPLRWLALDMRGRWLVLRVDAASAPDARALTARIERRLATGEALANPPTLP